MSTSARGDQTSSHGCSACDVTCDGQGTALDQRLGNKTCVSCATKNCKSTKNNNDEE
eukprot:m.353683 g.353683  ORF g.353683 m.353683 type:complete len:57 (-) comp16818_c0_seq1:231-401(-)